QTATGKESSNPFMAGCYLRNLVIEIVKVMLYSSQQMVFNSPCLTHKKELIHPKGTALVLRVEMVINSPWMLSKNWLVQKQMAFGKDTSNTFMADDLLKIIWFSTHHITCMKSWLVQKQTTLGQTATGKESSNLFMAGVNTPRSDEDRLKLMELMVFLMKKDVCDEFGLNAARLSKFLLSGKYVAEGFEQIIDFLSGSYINYALTVNPHVYISCIKQFWNTAVVKRSGDVTRLQALVDKKRIVISKEVVREILQLNDAEGVMCLPNEEIFAGLARMRYEKSSTKMTFYKAFFSTQWKFFIHTILHSLSAKRTSWNEFSSAMASALICLSSGQRFNFSKYIFESLGDDVQKPVAEKVAIDVVPPTPTSPSPSSPRVLDTCYALVLRVEGLENDKVAQQLEIVKLKAMVKKLEKISKIKSSKLRRRKGVVITNPKEELPSDTLAETPKVKDKSKRILIEAPRPMKKKDQIEMDAETLKVTRWISLRERSMMKFFQSFKPSLIANMKFLFKSKEKIEAEDEEIIKSINETPAQKAAIWKLSCLDARSMVLDPEGQGLGFWCF
nr:hypothetical protein [Tanacetum cinerariifolium]